MTASNPNGFQEPRTTGSDYATHEFFVRSILNKSWFATLVQVVNVNGNTVDVQPLINQIDSQGQPVAHGIINAMPFMRLFGGGGKNAIILDPGKGDIGLAFFAHHDTSAVVSSGQQSNPGSRRRNDASDGFFLCGVLNGAPTQSIAFNGDHIDITAKKQITFNCAGPVVFNSPDVSTPNGNIRAGTGATGTVNTNTSVLTITNGLITNIE